MMPSGSLEATRRAAVHCEALLGRRVAPAELLPGLDQLGDRLAAALHAAIALSWGETALQVRSLGARTVAAAALFEECGALSANSLHGFGNDHTVFLSIEGRALLEQVDRAFGGSGEVGGDMPAALPFSADLLAKRFEAQALRAFGSELGGIEFTPGERGGNAGKLAAFGAETMLAVLGIEFVAGSGRPWTTTIAVEVEHLPVLLPRKPSPGAERVKRKPSLTQAPLSELPLAADATLVDMTIPLRRLTEITPGAVFPITVARNVPLRVGEVMVARGSIGEVDDQVALQITQTFAGKDFQ